MLRTFTVAATRSQRSQLPWLSILFVLPCIALDRHAANFLREIYKDQPSLVIFSFGIIIILSGLLMARCSGETRERFEVSVFICELSVQISTSCNGKVKGEPIMIPKKSILDVVVEEIILSHKVVSVLIFRLQKCTDGDNLDGLTTPDSIQKLLAEDKVQLQVAFPGVELSYQQCLDLRFEMMKSLGSLSKKF
mmetsp:Transcript_14461/g.21306  ORF Transcript_14461/g.21306 Transcript_14461/m.21306 type:complete len:193 (-) Transcript_14461:847-1425(-)